MPAITGAYKDYSVATTTAATTNTPFMYKKGYAMGKISNPSAVTRTVAYYGMHITDGGVQSGPFIVRDEDGVAASQIIEASGMWDTPASCAAVPVLLAITTTGATTGATNMLFHFSR